MIGAASPGELRQFIRYLACGSFAASVNWCSRFLWSSVLPFGVAVIAAYATGMAVAFVLFRKFVFHSVDAGPSHQVQWFVVVNLVGMAATWALANLLVFCVFPWLGFTWHAEAVAHALAIAAPVGTSWFGHRLLTFR